MTELGSAWKAAAKEAFAEIAAGSPYRASQRGLCRDHGDVFSAVVPIVQDKRSAGHMRVTVEMRIWTRWIHDFRGMLSNFVKELGYPPVKYWYDRADTADWHTRWTDTLEVAPNAPDFPEWLEISDVGQIQDAVTRLRAALEEVWLPVLEKYSDPGELVAFWMGGYDPPHAGRVELRNAAVVAHGIGDTADRDLALEGLESLARDYAWHAEGREMAAQVRRWMAARA